MDIKNCFNLGYVARRIGNQGELGFVLDADDPSKYKNLKSVFIELNKSLVPFFITKVQVKGNNATVSIEGIDNISKAEDLVGKSLYLPLNELPPLKGKKFYLHELTDFKAIDKTFGEIGIVTGVLDFPQQTILQIQHGSNEVLIPAKEEFIVAIDRKKKIIELDAPEGLIDIYISNKAENTAEIETDEETE